MDTNRATDRNGLSRLLPRPIMPTPAETREVAGGSAYLPIPPAYAAHIPSLTHVEQNHLSTPTLA
jgi:hypothetical protein